jgi:hypothetical protein
MELTVGEVTSNCIHHWILETPSGPTSRGVCKLCGEEKDFPNSDTRSGWVTSKERAVRKPHPETLHALTQLRIILSDGRQYTAQQLANELGVSKTVVYHLVKDNDLVWNKPERVYKKRPASIRKIREAEPKKLTSPVSSNLIEEVKNRYQRTYSA